MGPHIASWSLGGAAIMSFKIKSKYWVYKERVPENYDPELPVQDGSQSWKQRNALNDLYKAGRMQEYETAKKKLFDDLNKKGEKTKKNGSAVLNLDLKHGDIVVMHGEDIQKLYDVRAATHKYLIDIS